MAYVNADGLRCFALIEYFVFIQSKVIAVLTTLNPIASVKQHFSLTAFQVAVQMYGLPSKLGSDLGGENEDIWQTFYRMKERIS